MASLGTEGLCITSGMPWDHALHKRQMPQANAPVKPHHFTQCCIGAVAALSAIRSATELPSLLLTILKASTQQLQQQGNAAEGHGLLGSALPGPALAEPLPGQAPGCGELLKPTSLDNKLQG